MRTLIFKFSVHNFCYTDSFGNRIVSDLRLPHTNEHSSLSVTSTNAILIIFHITTKAAIIRIYHTRAVRYRTFHKNNLNSPKTDL